MIFLGTIAAILLGVWALSDYEQSQGDPTILDNLGDFFYVLTTTEESRLNQLQPVVADKVRLLLGQCQDAGITVYVGQTLRTDAQEKANVAGGKTAAGLVYSWHELGRAVDLYPTVDGAPDFNPTEGLRLDAFRTMHALAVAIGFRSLAFNDDGSKHIITNAQGKEIWDGGHIEWREPYGTIAEAVAAEGAQYGLA
jgi:hypothetical protein